MYKIIKKIINTWDPINLFPSAPENEYYLEIREIYSFIKSKHDSCELAQKVKDVFTKSFGDIFQNTMEQCMEIANEINQRINS